MLILLLMLLCVGSLAAESVTSLWQRGYSVIPTPRNVRLAEGDVQLDSSWTVDTKLNEKHIAVRSLIGDLKSFHGLALRLGSKSGKAIRMAITPGGVATGATPEIDRQAYRLRLDDQFIEITGNEDTGLFYGVQTLVQLVKRGADGRLSVPRGTIEDWPALELRMIHWDVNQHQDRIETLKRYLDWTARFKVNLIAFQFEDEFHFPSHPTIGAPGAYTPEQYQELVDYGLERHIHIAPMIQAPGHFSWALKHPEMAEFRDDGNNYEANLCNPRTYDLIFSLYDDVLKASRGEKYFVVSMDEIYFAGIDPRCGRPFNPVNRSLLWVDFVQKAHEYLKQRGRKMITWVSNPLLPEHVKMLSPDIIGSTAPQFINQQRELGMRVLGYAPMRGEELLFPDYLNVCLGGTLGCEKSRVEMAYDSIAFGDQWHAKPIGIFGAAWDASGSHNETYWLGWATVAQYAWNPATAPTAQHIAEFMNVYYGPRAAGMTDIYQAMQGQARAWERTWDVVPSTERGPAYGDYRGKGFGTQRYDTKLSPPPLPQMPDLRVQPFLAEKYSQFLAEARSRMMENNQLILALESEFALVDRNQYNLEVYLSLARFMGHHWRLLLGLVDAEKSLLAAQADAQRGDPQWAVRRLTAAYKTIDRLRKENLEIFTSLTAVWEKSCYPRGRSANGRTFLHIQDDTKDYFAARRPDWTYLIAPEQRIGLDKWQKTLLAMIRSYAGQHQVPVTGLGVGAEN